MIVKKGKAEKLLGRTLKGRKQDFYVLCETGLKNLGGPYKTKKGATKRLRQVEYFKFTRPNPRGRAPEPGDRVAFAPSTFEMYYYAAQGLEPGDLGTIMATNPYKDPNANVSVKWDKGLVITIPYESIRPVSRRRRRNPPAKNTMVTSAAGNPQMDPFGIYRRNAAPAHQEPGMLQRVGEAALVSGLTSVGMKAIGMNPRQARYDIWFKVPFENHWVISEWNKTLPVAKKVKKKIKAQLAMYPKVKVRIVDAGSGHAGMGNIQKMMFNPGEI